MVEVVKKAVGYEVECPHCRSVLRIGLEDSDNFVLCPICDRQITTRSLNGELSSRLEPIYEEKGCLMEYDN